ncbi:MAG: helix-turn-helix transcriptional regulator [Pseudohongiellaceae bacterium]
MDLSKSQLSLLDRLKTRGPQSVKILSNQMGMTTMGIRQHLLDLQSKGLATQTNPEKQNRGRPIHLWTLTKKGHSRYPDSHAQVTIELINVIKNNFGETGLNQVINDRAQQVTQNYKKALAELPSDLASQINGLARLRDEEGYMAEVRLLPDGWLLIENHCPICAAATECQQFCVTELETFKSVMEGQASIERVDHLLNGARRCAYKITPLP